jgi:hypothetical protein
MKSNQAREVIRRRRQRALILPYIEHIDKVVKVQAAARRMLAARRTDRLRAVSREEEEYVASVLIQAAFRGHAARNRVARRDRAARTLTRFVQRVPTLRREVRIRELRRRRAARVIAEAGRRWMTRRTYIPVPDMLPDPRGRPLAEERLVQYARNREERQAARQHNWDVLNRRLRVIRRDIDNLLPADEVAARRAREETRLHTPHRGRRLDQVTAIVDTNNPPRGRARAVTPRTPEQPVPIPRREITIRPRRNTPPVGGLQRIARDGPEPPPMPQPNRVRQRLAEIERQFQDPRIRAIYQHNRILMPDGNRVLPGRYGGVQLQAEGQLPGQTRLPDVEERTAARPEHARDCPICMESKSDFRMIDPGCDHLICFQCAQTMIITALGDVSSLVPVRCPLSTTGCNFMITPYTKGIKELLPSNDYEKYEKYHILKEYVPADRLRYCPNSGCGLPFEIGDDLLEIPSSPPRREDFRLVTSCPECSTSICVYCNDYAHQGIPCSDFQARKQDDNSANSLYIKNYCKACPICKVPVQKLQTAAQERHEKETGLAGGTSECHHVTCGSCKRDFCWTCLKAYTGATYYHRTCPNEDCVVTFRGSVPSISNLPIAQHTHLKMMIYGEDGKTERACRVYQINNGQQILGARSDAYTRETKAVILHCNDQGVVLRIEGLLGDYSFRQIAKFDPRV